MREIKFRAWEDWTDTENENNMCNKLPKKMYNWNELRKCNKFWFAQMIQGEHSQIKLMQFTEFFDKNDKEIYEGDIVNIRKEKCLVKFEYGMFEIEMKSYGVTPLSKVIKEIEVIGNIYENPELLEEKKK